MGHSLKVAQGFDETWGSVLLNRGVPTPYPPSAPFDAAVWRGGDEAVLFAPAATWVDAAKATFAVAVSASQTAGLDPGLYRMQVGVSYGGVRSLAFDGTLEVLEAPGAGTSRAPYVTGRDLLYWYDQLGTLQTIKGGDATFLDQRAESSDEFDRDLEVAFNQNRHQVRTRRPTKDPVLDTFDVPDPTARPPGSLEFAAIVGRGGVIIDRNSREDGRQDGHRQDPRPPGGDGGPEFLPRAGRRVPPGGDGPLEEVRHPGRHVEPPRRHHRHARGRAHHHDPRGDRAMIRVSVKGPNFEPIHAMLDRLARPPLGDLAVTLREIMIADNRDGLLAGLNANGDTAEPVTESTIRRGRGGDGPPRVPRGAGSRAVESYDVAITRGTDRLVLIGSWSNAPFVHFLDTGTRHMVAREMVGIRPDGQEKIVEAVDDFVAELLGNF